MKSTNSPGAKAIQYLQLKPHDIRLISIAPSKKSTITCKVRYESLDQLPQYVAISYAWGDASDKKHIYLDGIYHEISASLFGALKALRRKKKKVLIWADALCINQQDNVEKSKQIKLMTRIYAKAKSVAIWLGPKADNSRSAIALLKDINDRSKSGELSKSWICSTKNENKIAAVEVFNASNRVVYCGSGKISWQVLLKASSLLHYYQSDLSAYFARISPDHHIQALSDAGPRSLLDRREVHDGEEALLDVLIRCRRKFSEKPQDKVFGLLGVLPKSVRKNFPVDYSDSVKEVFTDVVEFLISATGSLDVICESIHSPPHSDPFNLPSWVPDWSHIPLMKSLRSSHGFSASEDKKARYKFGNRRNELQISAVYLDTVKRFGVSVGTKCSTADYLMAFFHWRALLVEEFGEITESKESRRKHEEFCRTLNLDQATPSALSDEWMLDCYHVFSSLIRERLPFLRIDPELQCFINADTIIPPDDRRQFLKDYFGEHMMGRAFCITDGGLMGMGSGALMPGDEIVVPFGCRTPVILRADPLYPSKYKLIGDIYVDKYMHGRAMDLYRSNPYRREDIDDENAEAMKDTNKVTNGKKSTWKNRYPSDGQQGGATTKAEGQAGSKDQGKPAFEKLAEAQAQWNENSVSRNSATIRENQKATKDTAQGLLAARIGQLKADIRLLEEKLGITNGSGNTLAQATEYLMQGGSLRRQPHQ
ncbi:hypothetical protein G7054_g6267 [Neopestalotiopsis clavispora]|nr:hypothetical protein G7054_g6267 [Neopestalotiopsis clavispora]